MSAKYRFFFDGKLKPNTSVQLPAEQSRHAKLVLRLEEGSAIEIVNGSGILAQATLLQYSKHDATCLIQSVASFSCPFHLQLVFGISKGKALDFIIHKAVEIGVLSLQPIETQFSLKKNDFNSDRWQRVLQEAIKQNQSLFLPDLLPPLTLSEWMSQRDTETPFFFCDENERQTAPVPLEKPQPTELLVGSEGGFSEEERTRIAALSPQLLSLGSNRLRTETAAFVACILLKQKLGEL